MDESKYRMDLSAPTPSAPTPAPNSSRTTLLFAVAASALILCIGVVLWLLRPTPVHPETQQYTARQLPVEPLAEFFHSYDSIDAVVAVLTAHAYEAQRSASHTPRSQRYPPRDLDTLEVTGYEHLGSRGQLTLEFFNDRLYQARFEPANIRRYLPKVHAAQPQLQRDGVGRSERTLGHLRIATDIDLANSRVGRTVGAKPYLLWQDLRLKRQLAQWETRYGSAASLPD